MVDFPAELNLFRRLRLPVITSGEVAECGLACLAMVASYYGQHTNLNALRQRYSLSIAGLNLKGLMDLCGRLGFTSRAVRSEVETLKHIKTPAILHWNLNHFVVLESIGRGAFVIHDPAFGRRRLTRSEFSKHFTGVVLELQPTESFTPSKPKPSARLSALWSKMSGFRRAVAHVLVLSAGLQLVVFAMPFYLQLVVDDVLARGDASLLTTLAIGFGILAVLSAVIEALRAYALQVFGHLLNFQMIGNLVRHLLRLKTDFFEKRHVGDILSRIQSTRPIQQAISEGVVAVFIDGAMAVVALAIMFFYSVSLTMIVLGAVCLGAAVTVAFYPMIRRRSEEQIIATASEQSHLIESIRGATTIRVWGGEQQREGQWRNLFANAVNASFSLGKFKLTQQALQSGISGLQTVAVVYVAARIILAADGFSVGMLMAFLSFRQTFTDRINALINQALQFRLLTLHLERLGDVTNAEAENDSHTEVDLPSVGAISLKDVSFRYSSTDRFILRNLTLDVEAGSFVAITGRSGGGKTTLLKLILGLYEPTAGSMMIGGRNTSPSIWRNWRRQVGIVAQDDQLFAGTLADNIAFFDPDLDMIRVRKAAEQARLGRDIETMPMQYMSLVGDMGSSLSGGQRQRVLLARALYRGPEVLILDEGTANLDSQTENDIAEVIAALPITRIVVAHRPALIERADRVLEVRDGAIYQAASNEVRERRRPPPVPHDL